MLLKGLLWVLTDSVIHISTKDWKLVFKVDADGQNTNIYDLYMDNELTYNINDDDAQNVTQRNGKHFKSDIINHWEDIDVEQVKVVVYRNGVEQAFLNFDGTRTNKTNWFSQERLMNSTYSDLKNEDIHQPGYYFSINGRKR